MTRKGVHIFDHVVKTSLPRRDLPANVHDRARSPREDRDVSSKILVNRPFLANDRNVRGRGEKASSALSVTLSGDP